MVLAVAVVVEVAVVEEVAVVAAALVVALVMTSIRRRVSYTQRSLPYLLLGTPGPPNAPLLLSLPFVPSLTAMPVTAHGTPGPRSVPRPQREPRRSRRAACT